MYYCLRKIAGSTMLKKLIFTLICSGLFCVSDGYSQDAQFSQYFAHPLYLNPALAGNKICPRLTLNYRNQWPSISDGFVTYSASYDQYVDALHGGVGLMFVSDRAGGGILTENQISGMYNFRFNISKNLTASTGLQGTYQFNKLDWNKLVFEDQINTRQGTLNPTSEKLPSKESVGFADFSAGLLLGYKEKFYGGLAVHHLSEPDIAFYDNGESKLDMKITAHVGTIISLTGEYSKDNTADIWAVSPQLLYQQQGKFHQMNAGMYLNAYPFVGGFWYRHNFENPDAVIAMLGIQFDALKFEYSYDYTISKLGNASGGAHEISLVYQFACYEKIRKIRPLEVPNF